MSLSLPANICSYTLCATAGEVGLYRYRHITHPPFTDYICIGPATGIRNWKRPATGAGNRSNRPSPPPNGGRWNWIEGANSR